MIDNFSRTAIRKGTVVGDKVLFGYSEENLALVEVQGGVSPNYCVEKLSVTGLKKYCDCIRRTVVNAHAGFLEIITMLKGQGYGINFKRPSPVYQGD